MNKSVKPIRQLVATKYSNGKWKFSFHHGHMNAADLLYISRVFNKAISTAIIKQEAVRKSAHNK